MPLIWFVFNKAFGMIDQVVMKFSDIHHNATRLSLVELTITDTELNAIAALAIIGLRRIPKNVSL